MYQNEYLKHKIELACSVSAEEERYFAPYQIDFINSLRSGLALSEIAKDRRISIAFAYGQMAFCTDVIAAIRSQNPAIVKSIGGFGRHEFTQKNIDLLCALPATEYGKVCLTSHQMELINWLKKGLVPAEISQKWGTGVRNVYCQILTCATKILACEGKTESPARSRKTDPDVTQKVRKGRYQKFNGADFSVLGNRERELLKFRIDHPELSIKQIADMHGISYSTCASTLSAAARRLTDGKYIRKRYPEKESAKANHKESRRQWWKENREQYLPRLREYNKSYYQQNRDRILEKSRSQRAIKSAKLTTDREMIDGYRKSAGMSPEQFSEMFDIPLKTVQSWYAGKRNLPSQTVKQIVKKLKEQ